MLKLLNPDIDNATGKYKKLKERIDKDYDFLTDKFAFKGSEWLINNAYPIYVCNTIYDSLCSAVDYDSKYSNGDANNIMSEKLKDFIIDCECFNNVIEVIYNKFSYDIEADGSAMNDEFSLIYVLNSCVDPVVQDHYPTKLFKEERL